MLRIITIIIVAMTKGRRDLPSRQPSFVSRQEDRVARTVHGPPSGGDFRVMIVVLVAVVVMGSTSSRRCYCHGRRRGRRAAALWLCCLLASRCCRLHLTIRFVLSLLELSVCAHAVVAVAVAAAICVCVCVF
jgi:hypothetical protein